MKNFHKLHLQSLELLILKDGNDSTRGTKIILRLGLMLLFWAPLAISRACDYV